MLQPPFDFFRRLRMRSGKRVPETRLFFGIIHSRHSAFDCRRIGNQHALLLARRELRRNGRMAPSAAHGKRFRFVVQPDRPSFPESCGIEGLPPPRLVLRLKRLLRRPRQRDQFGQRNSTICPSGLLSVGSVQDRPGADVGNGIRRSVRGVRGSPGIIVLLHDLRWMSPVDAVPLEHQDCRQREN